MATTKPKTLEKTTAFTGKQRVRFAGYPSVDAWAIQYEPVRDEKGRIQYEPKRDRQRRPKTHPKTGKVLFKRDRSGKKIPVLDKSKPQYAKDGQTKKKKVAQLPWGFVVKDTGVRATWMESKKAVTYAECRRRIGGSFKRDRVWIREDSLQDQRCLEVSFVDIGQGDGCFLVTPENSRMVIDAGESDNMRRYLNWRHGTDRDTVFEAAIISHPDADHYKGFKELFYRKNFEFETIYTNGLMECAVPERKKLPGGITLTSLGPKKKVVCDDGKQRTVVTRLVRTRAELETFLDEKDQANWVTRKKGKDGKTKESRKQFPALLEDARKGKKSTQKWGDKEGEPTITYEKTMTDFGMLAAPHKDDKPAKGNSKEAMAARDLAAGYMPRYAPRQVHGKEFSIQVLGPVTRRVGGVPVLEWLQSVGKTKNGHSVVLLLTYGNVRMLLGGDLNIPSEELLLEHHTGFKCPPEAGLESAFLEAARKVFQVDIAKSCHHGSSDFTEWFLRALNPIATVISSGDDEPHSHPRSDTLGTIGRHSRSNPRPLIFSTELARSAKDSLKEPWKLKKKIRDSFEERYCEEAVEALLEELERQRTAAKSGEAAKKETKSELRERLAKSIQAGIEATDDSLDEDVQRSVAVYGTITVVTDGERVIIYQKLERKGSHGSYDIYRLEPGSRDKDGKPGPLMYRSKH